MKLPLNIGASFPHHGKRPQKKPEKRPSTMSADGRRDVGDLPSKSLIESLAVGTPRRLSAISPSSAHTHTPTHPHTLTHWRHLPVCLDQFILSFSHVTKHAILIASRFVCLLQLQRPLTEPLISHSFPVFNCWISSHSSCFIEWRATC